jgi:4'-phosphopantetheinyl transferase
MLSAPQRDEVHLIFSSLTGRPRFIDYLRSTLSTGEQERAGRFRFERDRNAFTVARGLLRLVLGKLTDTSPQAIEFRYGSHGKPFVSRAPQVRFNVSHSDDIVLYAFGLECEIGADVERIRPVEHMEDIAARFFSPAEGHDLLTVPSAARPTAFFNCWTRKEAFIKALGLGLSYPLDRFQVTLCPGQAARFVGIDGRSGSETNWSIYDVAPSDGHAAAVALDGRDPRFRVFRFKSAQECVEGLQLKTAL